MTVKDRHKRQAAEAALDFITPGVCLGVGSGSTVHYFIQSLLSVKQKIDVVVASSQATAKSLERPGFVVQTMLPGWICMWMAPMRWMITDS